MTDPAMEAARAAFECLRTSYSAMHHPDASRWPSWEKIEDAELRLVWAHFAGTYRPAAQLTDADRRVRSLGMELPLAGVHLPTGATARFERNPITITLERPTDDRRFIDAVFLALLPKITDWSWTLDESEDGLVWSISLLEPRL